MKSEMAYLDTNDLDIGEKIIYEILGIERHIPKRRTIIFKKGTLVLTNKRILFLTERSTLNFALYYKSILKVKKGGIDFFWMPGFKLVFNTVVAEDDLKHKSFSMTPFVEQLQQFFRFPVKYNAVELKQIMVFLEKAKNNEFGNDIESEGKQLFQSVEGAGLSTSFPLIISRILLALFVFPAASWLILGYFHISAGSSLLIGTGIAFIVILLALKREKVI